MPGKKPTQPDEPPVGPPKQKPDEIVPPMEPPRPEETIGDPPAKEAPIKADGDETELAMPGRGQPDRDSDEV